jgi:hypothetical protein
MAKRVSKGRRQKYRLIGGPFDGQVVELHSAGTLEFTVRGETGRYDSNGYWREKDNG